jgi:hypothetical protein
MAHRRRSGSTGERTHWPLAIAAGAIKLSYALSSAAASEILKAAE